ncbi:hypothetical protein KJ068_15590 [bacterium]|nr:hypothetical protein [bacterium]
MSGPLVRIKRLILAGRYRFTDKATVELESDSLSFNYDDILVYTKGKIDQ